jgi:hypothetical protein
MSETGRYVYAIGRALDEQVLGTTAGVDDSPLEVVRHRGLDAVVSTVSLAEFGEEGLKRNLENLKWLEGVARRHDDVVHIVAGTGTVAPLRLATICLDDDGVRDRLDEWYSALEQVLDRVQGRMEWSVKTFGATQEADDGAASTPRAGGPGAGAAYLQRRRTATETRQQAEAAALACADDVYEQLSSVSVASRRLRPQDPRLSGHEGTMTLNAAFLVEVDETAGFQAMINRLQNLYDTVVVVATGPWPPYSFAMLDQG